jgi:putative lipoic acid-binding regulatory protein
MADEPKGAAPPAGPGGPLLVYPTDYPFKAIGLAGDDLAEHVKRTLLAAVPGLAIEDVTSRPSSGGKYLSVTVNARLESEDQRRAVYQALSTDPRIVHYL